MTMKTTIGRLRKLVREVASEPKKYWGRGGAGIVFVCPDDDTILLGKRASWVADPGTWGSPGGSVDGGWTSTPITDPITDEGVFKTTAIRETEEECGSVPPGISFSGRIEFEDRGFRYVTYLVRLTPQQKATWQQTTTDGETDEWRWFPLKDLPSPLHPHLLSSLHRLGL